MVLPIEPKKGYRELAAAIIAEEGEVKVSDLNSFLKRQLPSFMVPGHICLLPQIPLTANGKIDRIKLEQIVLKSKQSAPIKNTLVSETEQWIAESWQELLQGTKVSRLDNFFDIGGNSLLGISFLSQVENKFDIRLTPQILMLYHLAEIAAFCDEQYQDKTGSKKKGLWSILKDNLKKIK